MIGRVTESMKYNILTSSMSTVQVRSASTMEKMSTQKNINRPSDDPVGAGKILNYSSIKTSIGQYQNNITNAKTWLSLTDTNLEGVKDIIAEAEGIAVGATDDTMDANAAILSSLIDEALSLMNAKQGDSYIFGGSRTDIAPFSLTAKATTIGTATKAANNVFDGTVAANGTYTGSEEKTYAVKIVNGGAFGTATCNISDDGGKTWSDTPVTIPASGTLTLGEGITMTFTAGTQNLAANDLFAVNASLSPAIGSPSAATANTFNGAVTSGGVYTGTENKTYALKIINGGTLAAATYQISADGGKTWGATQTNLSAPVTLGEGVTMTFTAGTQNLTADDLFTVNAYTAGYYQGNDNSLTIQAGKNNNYIYNITGSDAFTAANGPTATAAITNSGALTVEDTITLARGETAGSWTITNNDQYPDMAITSVTDTQITIDADSNGTNDITLSLSGEWQKGNTASFTIIEGGTPQTPVLSSVKVEGPGTVDLLGTLKALKSALETHDLDGVSAQIDDLKDIQTQVLQAQTEAGAKISNLELTSNNLTALNEQIKSMKSDIEDVDLDKLIVSYQIEQVALEASYNLAAQIGRMTILDYLR